MKNSINKAGVFILAIASLTPATVYENALGTLSGSLIIQEALDIVFNQLPDLNFIAMGFRNLDGRVDNALLGQSVISRIQVPYSVQNFTDEPQDVTDSDVTVALTARKKIEVRFTPTQYNSTDRDLLREAAKPIVLGLIQYVIAAQAALWLNANYENKVIVAAAWDYDNTLRALKKSLDDRGVLDVGERFLVPGSAVYDSLLADDRVVAAFNNPANGEAIKTGKLPMLLGLAVKQYNQLPGNGENLVAVAGTPDSSVYVARAPKNPEDMAAGLKFPGVLNYVEEPRTGFRCMVVQYIEPDTENVHTRLSWLEGRAVGNPNNLTRLVTA